MKRMYVVWWATCLRQLKMDKGFWTPRKIHHLLFLLRSVCMVRVNCFLSFDSKAMVMNPSFRMFKIIVWISHMHKSLHSTISHAFAGFQSIMNLVYSSMQTLTTTFFFYQHTHLPQLYIIIGPCEGHLECFCIVFSIIHTLLLISDSMISNKLRQSFQHIDSGNMDVIND